MPWERRVESRAESFAHLMRTVWPIEHGAGRRDQRPNPVGVKIIAAVENPAIIRVQSERSSAWLERVVWVHEVAGSNPVAPTIFLLAFQYETTFKPVARPPFAAKMK